MYSVSKQIAHSFYKTLLGTLEGTIVVVNESANVSLMSLLTFAKRQGFAHQIGTPLSWAKQHCLGQNGTPWGVPASWARPKNLLSEEGDPMKPNQA